MEVGGFLGKQMFSLRYFLSIVSKVFIFCSNMVLRKGQEKEEKKTWCEFRI